jgi:hypothetical protein
MQRVAVLRELPNSLNFDAPVFLAHAPPLIQTHCRYGKRGPEIPRLVGPIHNNRLREPTAGVKRIFVPASNTLLLDHFEGV